MYSYIYENHSKGMKTKFSFIVLQVCIFINVFIGSTLSFSQYKTHKSSKHFTHLSTVFLSSLFEKDKVMYSEVKLSSTAPTLIGSFV